MRGDSDYLERAVEAWEWFDDSGMINDAHLVNDGLQTQSGSCESNHGTTWTYNCEAAGTCNAERAQADSAYAFDRNALDQYGLRWGGPFDRADIARQESAVSLLTAGLSAAPHGRG